MCKQYRESTSLGTMEPNTDSDGTVTVSIRLDRTAGSTLLYPISYLLEEKSIAYSKGRKTNV